MQPNAITPYRTPVVRQKEIKKTSGIIRVSHAQLIRSRPHKCELPGFWKRFFFLVSEGSLFRCAGCGDVYQWKAYIFGDGTLGISEWKPSTIEKWEEHGGDK